MILGVDVIDARPEKQYLNTAGCTVPYGGGGGKQAVIQRYDQAHFQAWEW